MVYESKEAVMQDGWPAWLTWSGRFYCHRYRLTPKKYLKRLEERKWTHIAYYTLDGEPIKLAQAHCSECHEWIASKHCGDFVSCKCGKSSVDTDRWDPARHHYIGKAEPWPRNK